ncbi:hypothetical protein HFO42_03040 [Rhizobium leguminosarum]|uniref:Uncharacterized protein n=1 Tax=Rhizobium leguminosarum TaxID=384 RepID=A0AAJ1A4E3_RHILE|nr:hypothetical protein [Rhizobium leguminosarum]MBY5553265.1 hypothetical protein [Rhizobium leguminosarum]MBY5593151.1 hypothetical protein [Rhizobium leguminosarum]MBY5613710.1 hypothetical protein [Rhizobium leguminosarum]MBY5627119.1 hypothetical protein [Rhizobium leguminosarum]
MTDLASSLAEIEALKGITGTTACDIVVCPPFAPIERVVGRTEGSGCHRRSRLPEIATTG